MKAIHKVTIRATLTLLMLLTAVSVLATDYITDVMLIGNDNKTEFENLENSYKNQGWKVIDKDLNQGCGSGSAYIHLLYKTESSNDGFNHGYITDFYIKTGKNPPSSLTYNGRTYQHVHYVGSSDFVNGYGDLNDGCSSGSEYIYLFYTKDTFSDDRAVTGITFNDTQGGAVGANGGSIGYDLNTGCGEYSAFIYMQFETQKAILPFSGSGDSDSPYLIDNAADWAKFKKSIGYGFNADKCYKLTANIIVTTMVGSSGQPFKGTFDGNGKTLTVNISSSEEGAAPFQYINGATIKNLTVGGTVSSSNKHAAGLVGFCSGGTNTIDGCAVTANINGGNTNYAGGIVGHGKSSKLTIQNSYYSGNISNFKYLAGGLLGWSDDMTLNMSNCLFKGSFTPASGGSYHPIACTNDGAAVTASTNKILYLNTITPTAPGNKIIPEAEGIPVSMTYDSENWNTPVMAADGITYYANHFQSVVTIGDGTQITFVIPFNNNTNYSLLQQIYTAEEIGMAGTITSIAFRWNRSFSMEGVQVFLKHTDKSEFAHENDVVPISAADKVFEGTYSASGAGWATITLDTPFEYNGNSNLLVCTYDPTNGYPGEDLRCYYHETSNLSRLAYLSNEYVPDIDNLSEYAGYKYTSKNCNNIQLKIVADVFPNPANLRVSSFTDETATLSWDAPETLETITGYAYQYKKVSDDQWSAEVTLGSTATSATLTGLTASTDYIFRVKALYGDQYSSYTILRFTSAVSLPYNCGFEDGMDGWREVDIYYGYSGICTDASRSGGKGYMFNSGLDAPQYLISPRLPSTDDITVSFYYRDRRPDSGFWEYFQVGFSTKTDDINDFVWRDQDVHYATNIPWTLCESNFLSGTKYIAIRYNSTLTSGLYIDDIRIEVTSGYMKPYGLAASALTPQSATLTWEAPNNRAIGYAYQYKKDTETTWSGEVTVTGTSVTIGNLAANTTYDFRLKALYSGGNASNFASTRFTTEGAVVSLPYEYGFEDGMSSWRTVDGNLDTGIYSKEATFIHSGDKSFMFFSPQVNGSAQYLISPELANSPDMKVSFWFKCYLSENVQTNASFKVGYSTTTKDLDAFTWEIQEFANNTGWQEYITYFPAGTKYVAIKRFLGNFLYLDDFSLTASVIPATPSQLTATNLTSTSADLSWTGDAETYQVRYRMVPLFFEDFENGISEWKVVNQGGTANTNWQLEYIEIDKNHYAGAASYDETTEKFYTVDNWLISPQVTLDGTLKYMTAQTIEYPVHYEVLVSTTTNDIDAFTKIAAPNPPEGELFEEAAALDLSSYQGQKGYIAFRLNESAENEGANLGIDNVGIYPDGYSTTWTHIDATGESATVTSLQPSTSYEYQVQTIVSNYYSPWSDVASFTTNSIIPLADAEDNTETIASISDSEAHDVMLRGRTLYCNGNWNTLCLPFGISSFTGTPLEGATVKELDTVGTYDGKQTGFDETDGTLYLYFKNANAIEAGKPYIVRWEENGDENKDNITNPIFINVNISSQPPTPVSFAGGKVEFTGTYAYKQYTGEDRSVLLMGGNSNLFYPDGEAPTNVGAFRAYFQLKGITAGDPANDGGIRAFVLNFDNDETGITNTKQTNKADAWYSVDGLRLKDKPTQRGIYIRNDKKIFIK